MKSVICKIKEHPRKNQKEIKTEFKHPSQEVSKFEKWKAPKNGGSSRLSLRVTRFSSLASDPAMPMRGEMIIIVMGVSGAGKTTVGVPLAERLGVAYHDADDFHPPENREKLGKDIPLNDADRKPWLEILADKMSEWEASGGAVLGCSALKKSYRDVLRTGAADVRFVYLHGEKDMIGDRLEKRAGKGGHLVKDYDEILDGQFRDLEEPEDAICVSIKMTPDEMVDEIVAALEGKT